MSSRDTWPRRRARIVIALLLGLVVFVAVGCDGSAGRARKDDQRQEESPTARDRMAAVVGELLECFRSNGVPNYPGIEIGSDGLPIVPADAPSVPRATEEACRDIAERVGTVVEDARRHAGAELQPLDPFVTVLDAMDRFPLVALGDLHLSQEFHDFLQALLLRPEFHAKVDDIVVEFGNSIHQNVADRFLLDLERVSDAELSTIWRDATYGGRVFWDAPVYEEFLRTVRAVNWRLPRDQRIRVLLGDPPIDWARIRGVADVDAFPAPGSRDDFYADLVQREVLDEGRRALLIMGGNHFHRGEHANDNEDQPGAGTLLARAYPEALFVIDPLPFESPGLEDVHRWVEEALTSWPRPSIALLDGTWLAAQPVTYRALEPNLTYGDQVDAVLWLGPEDALTASQADPSIYRIGEYAAELRRRSKILSQVWGQGPIDLIAEGLALSTSGPALNEGRDALLASSTPASEGVRTG